MRTNKPYRNALTVEVVEQFHDLYVMQLWPTSEPVGAGEYRNRGLIESACARPFQTFGGTDLYPSFAEKAAALFHSLVANHPFENGNKRTAVLAIGFFGHINGHVPVLTNEQMYELATGVATYRQQGTAHDEAFTHLVRVFSVGFIARQVMWATLRKELKKFGPWNWVKFAALIVIASAQIGATVAREIVHHILANIWRKVDRALGPLLRSVSRRRRGAS